MGGVDGGAGGGGCGGWGDSVCGELGGGDIKMVHGWREGAFPMHASSVAVAGPQHS